MRWGSVIEKLDRPDLDLEEQRTWVNVM